MLSVRTYCLTEGRGSCTRNLTSKCLKSLTSIKQNQEKVIRRDTAHTQHAGARSSGVWSREHGRRKDFFQGGTNSRLTAVARKIFAGGQQ